MLDAASLALLLIVLLPERALAAAFRNRKRWRILHATIVGVSFPVLFVHQTPAGIDRTVGPLLLATVLSTFVWLFAELVWRWADHPGSARTATLWGAVAAVWSVPIGVVPLARDPDHVPFWLIDIFDKFFFGAPMPLLARLHLEAGAGPALEQLTPMLLFLSRSMVGIAFAGNLALVALAYEVLRGKVPSLPPRVSQIEGRVPAPFALLWPIATAYELWFGRIPAWTACQQIGQALCGISGIWILYLFSASRRRLRIAFWSMAAVHVLIPELFWIPCSVGCINAFARLTQFARLYTRVHESVGERIERFLSFVRSMTRPLPVIACLVLVHAPRLYFLDDVWVGRLKRPAPSPAAASAPPADMVRIDCEGTSFDIDRYEFPNRLGELPTTGITPRQAEAACVGRGKHLCTRDEWAWACSACGRNRYIHAEPTEDESIARVVRDCKTGAGFDLAPSGEHTDCRNEAGVYDLAGNAFEWVAMPARPQVYGLAGGSYEYDDDLTISCPFAVVVHELQVPIVDVDEVGFRCCR